MSRPEDEIKKLLAQYDKQRLSREKKLAKQLLQIYEECRKELYIKFIEAQAGNDSLKIEQIAGTLTEIEKQIKHYTDLTSKARQTAIDESFLMGQDFGSGVLSAGGVDVSVIAGVGMLNKPMIEALIGNVPKLAGKVEQDVLYRIRDELTRGAVMGESIPKIAKRVFGTRLTQEGMKKPFKTLQTRCEVIARTEIIKASDAGYEDLAINAQNILDEPLYDAWLTAADDRVDSHCRAIANGTDARYKSIDGYPGVYERGKGPRPVISTHPRCRCRRIPYLLSWAESGDFPLESLKGRENNNPAGNRAEKHKLYVDTPDLSEEARLGLAKTWADTLNYGKANNREVFKSISTRDGTEVYPDLEGDKTSVQFTPDLIDFLMKSDKGSLISVHNHPRNSSFSDDDLSILSKYESIEYLTVVGHDETRYMVRVGNGRRPVYNDIRNKYQKYRKKHHDTFRDKVRNDELDQAQAWKEHSHLICEEVARDFGWEYKRVMPDDK